MSKQTLTLLVGAIVLLAGGSLMLPQLLGEEQTPTLKWSTTEEVDVAADPASIEAVGEEGANALQRNAVELDPTSGSEERVDVILRGRVVDKFKAPIPSATVWLDFGRSGPGQRGGGNNRQRRVPDPVTTDREGRFAFQGQTFRNLRLWLQVAHERHAPAQFDKDVGAIGTEVDLGDLTLMAGGELRGRVTDLDGNGIPAAQLRLQPENGNTFRQLRDRDKLLPPFTTDQNGFFRRPHLAAGDWSVSATAKMHTEGRSGTFVVEEDQVVDVDDIRLGPGFEVTGYVRNTRGEPIAKAAVTLQSEGRRGGGPGGRTGNRENGGNAPATAPGAAAAEAPFAWGGGREHRTTTDATGRFFLEHLPGATMRLQVDADTYLDYRQNGVEPTLGQVLHVAMQDGLRIDGRVTDGDGQAVTSFAFRAARLRGLPAAGAPTNVDLNRVMEQLRSGGLDEATRAELMGQAESLRAQFGEMRRGPGGPGGGPGQNGGRGDRGGEDGNRFGGPRDLGKPEPHADGRFAATGLQEGIYEVHVQSPEHARHRSAEVEVRNGAAAPQLTIQLDSGVFVAGFVVDDRGNAVRGARVELRTPPAWEGAMRGRGGRGGNRESAGGNGDVNAMARDFARMAAGTQLTLDTTADAEGTFLFKHVPRGSYRLQAEARGFASATGETFELSADRSGLELRLGTLGAIAGKVHGLLPADLGSARVAAVVQVGDAGNNNGGGGGRAMEALMGRRGGGGPFQNVSVAADGTYRIENLVPGAYIVRAWIGSTQDLMREMGPQFFANTLQPDATVAGGETTQLDLTALRPQIGTVAGSVLHNGKPGAGLQVELSRQDNGGNANGGARGGRGGRGGPEGFAGFGGNFQSAVSASGKFSIPNVPPGSYRLRVVNNRRGGALHEEIVAVENGATTERALTIYTHALQGTVTAEAGVNAADLNGQATLLANLTELPADFRASEFRNGGVSARVAGGKFAFDALKAGNYLLVVTVRGRERVSQAIVVQGDQTTSIAAGKPAAPATPSPQPAAAERR